MFVAFPELLSHGGVWFNGLFVSRNEMKDLILSRFDYINPIKLYVRVFNDQVSEWNFSSLIFKFS